MNYALMIWCGTSDLLRVCHDNIMTNSLFKCDHMKGGRPEAQATTACMREGVTNELKGEVSVGSPLIDFCCS